LKIIAFELPPLTDVIFGKRVSVVGDAMVRSPTSLTQWSTEELEQGLYSDSLDVVQKYQAKRILRERERAPDRELMRRLYHVVSWTLAFAMGAFIVSLMIYWLIATGK
jgi:hypothetical protein